MLLFVYIFLAIIPICTSQASQSLELTQQQSPSDSQILIDSAIEEYRYAAAVKILNQNFQWPTKITKMRSSCPRYQLHMKMQAIKHILIAPDTIELPNMKRDLGIENTFYMLRDQQLGKRALLKYRRTNYKNKMRQQSEARAIAQLIQELEVTTSDDESDEDSNEE